VLFYRSLAEGTMSIVAPISACGAVVPVAAALVTGNQPGTLAALGVLTAIAGVVLVSRPNPSAPPPRPAATPVLGPPPTRAAAHPPRAVAAPARPAAAASPARGGRVVAMALGSALGFGLFYVFVDAGTAVSAGAAGTTGSHGSAPLGGARAGGGWP